MQSTEVDFWEYENIRCKREKKSRKKNRNGINDTYGTIETEITKTSFSDGDWDHNSGTE